MGVPFFLSKGLPGTDAKSRWSVQSGVVLWISLWIRKVIETILAAAGIIYHLLFASEHVQIKWRVRPLLRVTG